jgi:hypothetical protein
MVSISSCSSGSSDHNGAKYTCEFEGFKEIGFGKGFGYEFPYWSTRKIGSWGFIFHQSKAYYFVLLVDANTTV